MADLDRYLPEIAAGDPEAFGRWVAGAEPPLRDSLARFAATVDVEAVLQEALLRVWQVAPKVHADGRPNALLRMAVRIARNLAVSEIRRYHRVEPSDGEDLERILDAIASHQGAEGPDPLLRRLIQECRDLLPSKPRLALEQRLLSGGNEPDQTLAERVGMKLNTFLQNFTRARKFLADCLKSRGVELEAERP